MTQDNLENQENSVPPVQSEGGPNPSASDDLQQGPESWNLDALPPEMDYFRTSEAYQVDLTGFQGPMDLLLHLINKEHMDIYDIHISVITHQFIEHIKVIQAISLDTAGEFIAMAATLMVIKMKMLMPSHNVDDEEDEDDPRAELVRRLLEYRRFKDAAESLQRAETERQQYHLRQTKFPFTDQLDLEPKLRIEMFDLLSALAGIFDRLQSKPIHEVEREPFTVDEKMVLIEERVKSGADIRFEELFENETMKMEVIVTFIAILELVKRGRLEFLQTSSRGPIWLLAPKPKDDEESDPADLDDLEDLEDLQDVDDIEEVVDEDKSSERETES
ncbi:MAG: segregation/condensation protein A [bacterium]|nr:segregation/condensation protein A [bacterium]